MLLKMISFFGTCTCFERRDTIVEQAFEAQTQNLHFGTTSPEPQRSISPHARTDTPIGLKLGESTRLDIPHLPALDTFRPTRPRRPVPSKEWFFRTFGHL